MESLIRRIREKPVGKTATKKIAPRGEASAISLGAAIDRYLDTKEGGGTKKITGFHPSYGYKCKRRWVLLFRGAPYEKDFTARTQRIFDNGNEVHARWRDYFRSMGILVGAEVEVKVNDPVPIRGHADGILEWGGRKLYELKSINPTRFEFRRMYKKPDERTYHQAQLYLWALNLQEGYVIYENKGTQEVLIFPIELDEVLIDKILKKWGKVYDIYQEDRIPARPYKRESEECSRCDLANYCWNELEE